MKSKNISAIILCLFVILFATSCEPTTPAEKTINDDWVSTSGNGVTISGTTGTLYVFSPSWTSYESAGIVSIGDLGFMNLTKLSTYTWSCNQLTVYISGGIPQYTIWSDDTELTMSNDGESFVVVSNYTLPSGPSSGTSTFYRQN